MDTVLEQKLESVEIMPDGEIRARWARHIREATPHPAFVAAPHLAEGQTGQERYLFHRVSFQPGDTLPQDVAEWIAANKAIKPKFENPAERFLRSFSSGRSA